MRCSSAFIPLILLLVSSCDSDVETDSTDRIQIDGWENFSDVRTGTYVSDPLKWLAVAVKNTNTALVYTTFRIFVKKESLQQKNFPISLNSGDFSISEASYQDEPGGQSIITNYDVDSKFEITDVRGGSLFASFSGTSDDGKHLNGKFVGIPLNFDCPVGTGYSPPCPLAADFFTLQDFRVQTDHSGLDRGMDPRDIVGLSAAFRLTPNLESLKSHLELFDNHGKLLQGELKVAGQGQVDFVLKYPLRRGVSYFARIRRGVTNDFNDMVLQKDAELNFVTTCADPLVLPNKLFNNEVTVQLGDSIIAEDEPGSWSILEGSNGVIANNNKHFTSFTGTETEIYKLRWTPASGCVPSDLKVDMRPLVLDNEGNKYHQAAIGNQVWMAENLRSTKDANGNTIPNVKDRGKTSTEGRYYQWEAAINGSESSSTNPSGVQGICPNGWHLPSAKEFQDLLDFASTDGRAVHVLLKDRDTWSGGVDAFGFKAVKSGYFLPNSNSFYSEVTYFWTTDKTDTSHAVALYLREEYWGFLDPDVDYQSAVHVRCVKN